jgi:hypothetical protein
MVVTLHVLIALASLLLVTYSFLRPSKKILVANYASIVATVASGFLLVIIEPARMLHTCVAGLAYLAIAVTASVMVQLRLGKVKSSESHL